MDKKVNFGAILHKNAVFYPIFAVFSFKFSQNLRFHGVFSKTFPSALTSKII